MSVLGKQTPQDRRIEATLIHVGMVLAGSAAPDADRYSVHWAEWGNGAVLSRGAYELTEETATDRKAIVRNIVSGEWRHIDAIRVGNEALNTYRNVTAEIADEVLQHCIDEEVALSSELRGWLHTHVGIRAVEDAITEHPYLDDNYHCGWNR